MIWLKRFASDFVGTLADSFRAFRALPWLMAGIVLWEFAQHVVEVRIGMFESKEATRAVGEDGTRMIFGWIKMALVYVGGFFVIRHFAGKRDGIRIDPLTDAVPRYLPYMVYSLSIFAAIFYTRSYAHEDHVDTIRMVVGLSQLLIEPLLMAWIVAAATDGEIGNPLASAKRTGLLYFYALPLYFTTRVPPSLAHNQLHELAYGQDQALVFALMAVDSLVVGLIVAIPAAAAVRVGRLVRNRLDGEISPDERRITA
ncbi:hypothetical protein [Qipengyuania sp. RANM35]|uniref:hypothetical protein n=1 Tax=Qipengyuania sp. RANM35 TaxID=3068635 RepID=UPI0034DB5079